MDAETIEKKTEVKEVITTPEKKDEVEKVGFKEPDYQTEIKSLTEKNIKLTEQIKYLERDVTLLMNNKQTPSITPTPELNTWDKIVKEIK